MFQLKDLLPEALCRGRISKEMAATKIVEIFNEIIPDFLPVGRKKDLAAISFKDRILNVNCQNTAVAHWLSNHELDLIAALAGQAPEVQVIKIRTRIGTTNERTN
ncbi:MAG: hypothetical protein V1664_04330 [Candidatus Uhrbacteria bacterium]